MELRIQPYSNDEPLKTFNKVYHKLWRQIPINGKDSDSKESQRFKISVQDDVTPAKMLS